MDPFENPWQLFFFMRTHLNIRLGSAGPGMGSVRDSYRFSRISGRF